MNEEFAARIAESKKSAGIICQQIRPILNGKRSSDALLALLTLFAEVARDEKAPKDRRLAVLMLERTAKIVQSPK